MAPLTTSVSVSGTTQHAGEDYTLTCTVSGGETTATSSYRWLMDNSPLSGETSATLSFMPLGQSNNGQYVCEATRGGSTVTSHVVTIDITSKLKICHDNYYSTYNIMNDNTHSYSSTTDTGHNT